MGIHRDLSGDLEDLDVWNLGIWNLDWGSGTLEMLERAAAGGFGELFIIVYC